MNRKLRKLQILFYQKKETIYQKKCQKQQRLCDNNDEKTIFLYQIAAVNNGAKLKHVAFNNIVLKDNVIS